MSASSHFESDFHQRINPPIPNSEILRSGKLAGTEWISFGITVSLPVREPRNTSASIFAGRASILTISVQLTFPLIRIANTLVRAVAGRHVRICLNNENRLLYARYTLPAPRGSQSLCDDGRSIGVNWKIASSPA